VLAQADDSQSIAPFEKPGKLGHRETNRIGGSPRLALPFDVKRQLFAQKVILGGRAHPWDLNMSRKKVRASMNTSKTVRRNLQTAERLGMVDGIARSAKSRVICDSQSDKVFAEHSGSS